MPVLDATQTVDLGPYQRGAILTFTAPVTDNIFSFPTLNNVPIGLTYLPKSVTLAQGNTYRLIAGNVDVTYNVQV